ncbi:MAG: heat-inducible transcriptional repressor HrcA [Clostridiales bacterium]|nr:heat-inducible transcriptional repressor HrcA [Clostridiales bacterium]
MIGDRRAAILGLIIESYIKDGVPIGSKTLCSLLPYSISSATIRNEMARLSELGLLEQMHTSGGRIPSKASYRYYVDNLLKPVAIKKSEADEISRFLGVNASDPERLLGDAAKLLAGVTNCVAFYSTVEDKYDCIQGLDLIPAGGGRAMLVMLSVGGKIKSSVCNVSCAVDSEFLAAFHTLAAARFIGAPLSDVNDAFIQSTLPYLGDYMFDMLGVLTTLAVLCREAYESRLVIEGETNLFSHSELGAEIYRLLSFLAGKQQLKQLLAKYARRANGTELFIGNENYNIELKNTATLLSKINYNNSQQAVLGLMGSVRIDYNYVLPRAEYIIAKTKELLQKEVV